MKTRKQRAALVSVGSNTTLVLAKVVVGVLSGSVSVLSEAIHSANDLLAALIAWWSVRYSDRPPDEDHPYGHGKIESISGAFEAGLIILAAVWIVVEAVRKLITRQDVDHLGLCAAVMLVSGIINIIVSRYLYRVAKTTDSLALSADAAHLSADVYTSFGVAVGLTFVWWTGWHILDPIVAILVALFILRIGWNLVRDAGSHLLDERLPQNEIDEISRILNAESRIASWHELRTRKSGSQRHIDVHIAVAHTMTFLDAHTVADDLEKQIAMRLQPAHVVIHVDPAETKSPAQ